MQNDWEHALEIAVKAAHAGAEHLLFHWGKLNAIRSKSSATDLVTEADLNSEKAIKQVLLDAFPSDRILAEESGGPRTFDHERLWVIDPLDGTTNYTHQYPFFAVSIGLVWQSQIVVGVIYNPFFSELFTARSGGGCFLNGERIHVSTTPKLEQSLLATGFSYDRQTNPENNYAQFCKLTHICQGVRRCGAACLDLAYVAAGRLDGYWERGLQPWDIAAGAILVQEAGGALSGYSKQPLELFSGKVVATNGLIHNELCDTLLA